MYLWYFCNVNQAGNVFSKPYPLGYKIQAGIDFCRLSTAGLRPPEGARNMFFFIKIKTCYNNW